jgi:hydroxymethylpyrimidine/phosphomethylpyrimidine kinase
MRNEKEKPMRTALTIAGSDTSGGAGIQADLKTMTVNGVFAMSAVTALTAQNTTGVTDIMEVTSKFLGEELDAVFTDIFPDAVKIGMVSSAALIEVIAERLAHYQARHIVLDPVMVATSGAKLLRDDAADTLKQKLMPLAEIITPNIPEAEILSGFDIETEADMEKAGQAIGENLGCAVLVKGGHQVNDANDYLWQPDGGQWFTGRRIDNPNTHGTGCTLSSAIAANLAKGYALNDAVAQAKAFLSGALADGLDLGKGSGPMNHAFDIKDAYKAVRE